MNMKKYYWLLALLPVVSIGQTVSVVDVAANDIVYSSLNGKLYVTLASSNPDNMANGIASIDPITAELGENNIMGNNPTIMAISSDGTAIYCGYSNIPAVRKFNVATDMPSIEFQLGSETLTGSYYAEDIEVSPTNPNLVAVSRRNVNYAPKHEGIALFENGVMKPDASRDHTGSNQIEFFGTNQIFGYNTETSERGIRMHTYDNTGVSDANPAATSAIQTQLAGSTKFTLGPNAAYFDNGKVVTTGAISIAATLEGASGPMFYNPSTNLVCYAVNENGANTLKFFDANTNAAAGSFAIPDSSGPAISVTGCGSGCYAFNTQSKVFIVSNLLGTSSADTISDIVMYPNPAGNTLNISSPQPVTEVAAINHLGQKVYHNASGSGAMDISSLSPGIYYFKISTGESFVTRQIIKN